MHNVSFLGFKKQWKIPITFSTGPGWLMLHERPFPHLSTTNCWLSKKKQKKLAAKFITMHVFCIQTKLGPTSKNIAWNLIEYRWDQVINNPIIIQKVCTVCLCRTMDETSGLIVSYLMTALWFAKCYLPAFHCSVRAVKRQVQILRPCRLIMHALIAHVPKQSYNWSNQPKKTNIYVYIIIKQMLLEVPRGRSCTFILPNGHKSLWGLWNTLRSAVSY